MIRRLSFVACLSAMVACGASPTTPTSNAPAAVRTVGYDINVPVLADAASLRLAYPDGVAMGPVSAQARWDYSRLYGSPNVYFGATGPQCEYIMAGIVTAPLAVASVDTFTAKDWPTIGLEPGLTYQWVGRFVYTRAAMPGEYVLDPTGAGCWRPK